VHVTVALFPSPSRVDGEICFALKRQRKPIVFARGNGSSFWQAAIPGSKQWVIGAVALVVVAPVAEMR
jgi:hypothetical protein